MRSPVAALRFLLALSVTFACLAPWAAQEPPVTVKGLYIAGNEGHWTEGDTTNDQPFVGVELAAPLAQTVHIKVETVGGTATPGTDYLPLSEVFEYLPGETFKYSRLTVIGDLFDENNETVIVRATQEGVLRAQTTLTIDDNDTDATVSVSPTAVVMGEMGNANFRLLVTVPGKLQGRFEYATADGSANAGEDYLPVSGSIVVPAGSTLDVAVPIIVLSDKLIEPDETFSLILKNPTTLKLARTSVPVTIVNDDFPPPPYAISPESRREGNTGTTPIDFFVRLGTPSASPVTVVVQSNGAGSATPGVDYAPLSQMLTFPPGVTELSVTATVFGDTVPENDESFEVELRKDDVVRASALVKILNDDDFPPPFTIPPESMREGDAGTTPVDLVVTLGTPSTSPVTVTVRSTGKGSATAGVDYQPLSQTLTFPSGVTELGFRAMILGDTIEEQDETFALALLQDGLEQATTTVKILDDDSRDSGLRIADLQITETDGEGATAQFTVTLSQATAQQVGVTYQTVAGTAIAGQDFEPASGLLVIQPGETSGTISVTVKGDLLHEDEETFRIDLSNPTGAYLEDGSAVCTIVDEDPLKRRSTRH